MKKKETSPQRSDKIPAWLRRLKGNRFVVVALVALLLVLLVVGLYWLNRSKIRRQEEGSQLQVAVTSLPATLDPAENTANQTETVLLHLFENLLRQERDSEGNTTLVGAQAESYDVEEIYDGTVKYTFHLRKNALWSDGKQVKAADFVYAWRRLAHPENHYGSASFYLNMIQGYDEAVSSGDMSKLAVKALDDSTLQVTLSRRCTYFLSDTCTSGATMPLRQDMKDGWTTDLEQLISNGPYGLSQWRSGQSMLREKSETYYNLGLIKPKSIEFTCYETAESAYAAYEKKQEDFVLELPNEVVKEVSLKNLTQASGEKTDNDWDVNASLSSYAVLFNHQAEGVSDPLVRQAFSLAIDRSALLKALGGAKIIATGLVPYGVADDAKGQDFRTVGGDFYGVEAEDYSQAKEEAVKLLEQAGYPGGKGFPVVEYWYESTSENAAVARQLQTMWKNVLGVTVTLRSFDSENWQDALLLDGFHLMGYEMTAPYNDALYFLQPWTTEDPENWMHYSSHVYDLLISASINFSVEGTHSAYLHEAESLLMESYALAPLFYNTSSYAVRSGLSGLYNDAEGHYFFYYVTEEG